MALALHVEARWPHVGEAWTRHRKGIDLGLVMYLVVAGSLQG